MQPRLFWVAVLAIATITSLFVHSITRDMRALEARVLELELRLRGKEQDRSTKTKSGFPRGPEDFVGPESNSRVPLRDGKELTTENRLVLLEKKFNGALNWVRDPHAWLKSDYHCKNVSYLAFKNEKGEEQQGVDHGLCMDNWGVYERKERECIIYDIGVRAQPEFGVRLAKLGCKVFAFDPSPVTKAAAEQLGLFSLPNYNLTYIGAGGIDGDITLFEYNWQQVSIIRYPVHYQNNRTKMVFPSQETHKLPVLTLPSMMKMHGHEKKEIAILKIDIEGSEFGFLEQMFDEYGCPPVEQIAMEWHHYDLDLRYGSSPELGVLTSLLRDCGFRQFTAHDWIFEDQSIFGDDPKTPRFRYQLASWCKRCNN